MPVKKRISIIIPVYNVQDYISRCLNSLASQTFTDLEVLFIDDHSTDNSKQFITDFINKYTGAISFRLICQDTNQGQSIARNRGIMESTGDYIYFLDSDDYLSNDCIELLYKEFEKDESIQMVIGNYEIIGPLHFATFDMEQRIYESEELINEQLRFRIYSMPWNKLIKKSFLVENELLFQPGIVHEDNLWSFCSAFCFDKIAVVRKKTYYYVVHQGSTERSHDREWHQQQLYEVFKHLIRFIFTSNAPAKKDVRHNTQVYRFVDNDIVSFIMEPLLNDDTELSFNRYTEIKELPYWKLQDIMRLKHLSIRRKWNFLHFLLPVKLGYKLYIKQHSNYKTGIDMSKNRISVITINYNNLQGLKRTLPSILSQTYTGYELIVIDGGSTDGSKEYLQAIDRIDYLESKPDRGIYHAMNKAVQAAHGEYCIFMNSGDTFFSPQALENVVYKLHDYDFITGCATVLDGQNTYTWYPPTELSYDLFLANTLNHQATFNRTALLKENPFNENFKIVSDWELFVRLFLTKKCTFLPITDMIAIYYLDGISSLNKGVCEEERSKALRDILKTIPNESERKDYTQKLLEHESSVKKQNDKKTAENKSSANYERMLRHRNLLKKKVDSAFLLSPIQRDLKILRNSFKMLFKDLFL